MPVSTFMERHTLSSNSAVDVSPVDEFASWLGDDRCTSCGNPVNDGNLYCSRQCRDEDAKGIDKETTSTSPPNFSVSTLYQPMHFASDIQAANSGPKSASSTSPTLLARFNVALTSSPLETDVVSQPKRTWECLSATSQVTRSEMFNEMEPPNLDLPPSITPATSALVSCRARDYDNQMDRRSSRQDMHKWPRLSDH